MPIYRLRKRVWMQSSSLDKSDECRSVKIHLSFYSRDDAWFVFHKIVLLEVIGVKMFFYNSLGSTLSRQLLYTECKKK